MYTVEKLSAMPYAQATVHKMVNGRIVLISYTTTVAAIDEKGWLVVYGLYSATTRRHIGAFVKEYAGINYQVAKDLHEKKWTYNIYTGEICSL